MKKQLFAVLLLLLILSPIYADEPSRISIPERFRGLWRNDSEILEVTENNLYSNGMPLWDSLNDAIEDGRVACYTRESNGAYTILLSNPDLGSSISYVFALEDGRYLLFGTNVPEEPFGSKQYRYWPVE